MEFCPHFVDNERFAQAAAAARDRRDEVRLRWALPAESTVFVFAAKFIPKKRPLDFVRAIGIAAEKSRVAGVMVGDGPLRADIVAVIKETASPVHLCGFLNQSEIPAAYAAGDVLVLPSDGTETWGLVVNEAMACGLPAVITDQVGCGPDLVTDGETGYIFPCGDVPALAAHLSRLAANPELRLRLGNAARQRVERYSVQAAAEGMCRAVARVSRRRLNRGTSETESCRQ